MSLFAKIQKVEKISPRLRNLYLHRIARDIGASLVGMYGPIFFYILSGSLQFVLTFYGLICLLYFVFIPLWAKLIRCLSMHILMMIGNLLLILYFIFLYFLARSGDIVLSLIILLILSNTLFRLFYWAPYHIDFARFVNKHHRGRQLSFLAIIVSLLGIVLPIVSAFIISRFGFPVLFIFAIVLIFISSLPIFFILHTREKYSFSYFETFRKLFSKKHFKTNLAYFADGVQDYVGALIWPIFIFTLLEGEYMSVGLVSAAIVLVTCILRYVTGEAVDRFDKKKLMKLSSLLYSLGWFFKAIVASGFHIFLVGVYHNFASVLFRTPLDVLTYEIAADEGHYVDEFTILREMSLNLGRVLMVVFSLVLLIFVNMAWIFIVAAIVPLLDNLVSKEEVYLVASCQ